ncbi:hypothetical protein PQQ88_01220 [Paraburkholderia caledonica]|uniref:hypothetical protein n=1 Tax=Paraburkholderia caledonica TaxID=134536 RepID=UPI0038B81432
MASFGDLLGRLSKALELDEKNFNEANSAVEALSKRLGGRWNDPGVRIGQLDENGVITNNAVILDRSHIAHCMLEMPFSAIAKARPMNIPLRFQVRESGVFVSVDGADEWWPVGATPNYYFEDLAVCLEQRMEAQIADLEQKVRLQ